MYPPTGVLASLCSGTRFHPEKFWFSTSVFVCCKFFSETSFIFLSDIVSRAATCYITIDLPTGPERVLCAVPLEYSSI